MNKKAIQSLVLMTVSTLVSAADLSVLQWDAANDPRVTSYKVYWGDSSRSYQSNTNNGTNTVFFFERQQTPIYFAVTAVDVDGLESEFSHECGWFPQSVSPATPAFRLTLRDVTNNTLSVTLQSTPNWIPAVWSDVLSVVVTNDMMGFFRASITNAP